MNQPGFAVHGARGSAPAAGSHVERYGGHTTCYSIDGGGDGALVVDAGTALAFSPSLASIGRYHLFFTHFHLDHVQGLPFFSPIYDEDAEFTFYGVAPTGHTLQQAVAGVFQPPWFPVDFCSTASKKSFVALNGQDLSVGGISVSSVPLNHPQGCTAYRFDRGGASVVVATDHEAGDDAIDGRLATMADGADVLLHDGQYTRAEYAAKVGWGHSTWEAAAGAATRAGVGELVLTSHDPEHSDAAIDELVSCASDRFEHVSAAAPGLHIPI